MTTIGLFLGLILLFILLGVSAELTLRHAGIIGRRLRITQFSLGLLLGAMTTLPELFIGIHATLNGVSAISFGNIMGGIVVILGLVGGLSIVFNRTIQTTKLFEAKWLVLMGAFIIFPMFLALDSVISGTDGVIIALVYFLIISALLRKPRAEHPLHAEVKDSRHPTKRAVIMMLVGIVGIIAVSRLIIGVSLSLVAVLNLPLFVTGALIFSLGTNLPELAIAFSSWKNHVKRVGLGNVLGSAFTNSFIIGLLALLRPISINTSLPSFWILFGTLGFVIFLYIFFGLSDHKFTYKEGLVLLLIYALFFLSQLGCLFSGISYQCEF